jgi:hypothetical protein
MATTTDAEIDALDRRVRAILSAVDQCRRVLIDLTIEDKVIAMERLSAWVELERSTSEQQH